MVVRVSRWQDVDGVLLLDKAYGVSSNAMLQRARRALNARSAGHTGTLDPAATGLLIACFGEATKFSAELLDAGKTYIALARLGETSLTGDAEGPISVGSPFNGGRQEIELVLRQFLGDIVQIPPMYSALKHEGKPLYAYAREGQTIARKPRQVRIEKLNLLDMQLVDGAMEIELEVACSKGTYIRTLAEDIGKALGCGAYLRALRRTRIGSFAVDGALRLDGEVQADQIACQHSLLPIGALLTEYPQIQLDGVAAERFCHGQAISAAQASTSVQAQLLRALSTVGAMPLPQQVFQASRLQCRVLGPAGQLLGTAWLDAAGVLQPKRLLASSQNSGL